MAELDVPELSRNRSTKLRRSLCAQRATIVDPLVEFKFAFEKCGYFCGYTPSKKCEIVGSIHSLRKFGGTCNTLIMGDIEQF